MAKLIFICRVAATLLTIWLVWTQVWPRLRARIPDDFQKLSGSERVRRARDERGKVIAERFRAAGLAYPGEIFIRWLKTEAVIELWARNRAEPFRQVASWPILTSSGRPGPKRREGDRQVPEGFYEIDRLNPQSLFHLSLGLDYPNAADRILSDPKVPGSDIFIHGKTVSVGCAPIGDAGIEELYLAALEARAAGQARIEVHIFPARMSGAEWQEFVAPFRLSAPELVRFWEQLQPVFDAFERTRQLPQVTVAAEGAYCLRR